MRIDGKPILQIHPAHEPLKHAPSLAAQSGTALNAKEATKPGSVADQVEHYQSLLPQEVEAPDQLAALARKVARGELLTREAAEKTADAILTHLFQS